ncbi:hypothetical protein GWI33_016903 [Rhynchophorus ferrugineus]|uniref:Uncharacterized protein n=1 Tax=Rhynchophorus ferrugineus TaxID=354439 RepID=A0A834M4I0_RHYFE|nr:hypothetical protein GWI33_016903 [Rhynchophorus ferrugineus]
MAGILMIRCDHRDGFFFKIDARPWAVIFPDERSAEVKVDGRAKRRSRRRKKKTDPIEVDDHRVPPGGWKAGDWRVPGGGRPDPSSGEWTIKEWATEKDSGLRQGRRLQDIVGRTWFYNNCDPQTKKKSSAGRPIDLFPSKTPIHFYEVSPLFFTGHSGLPISHMNRRNEI